MKSSPTRAAIGAATLLVTLAVAGCEEAEPSSSPAPSSTPSSADSSPTTEATPTASETGPVEPTLPPDAEQDTKAGVEAFVRFYWDVVNYATKTGDVRLLESLAQPSCNTCAAGIEGVENIYDRGGRIVGGDYKVVRLNPVQSGGGDWAVVAHTRVGDQRTVGAGDLNGRFPSGHAKWLIGVARINGAWSVATLETA